MKDKIKRRSIYGEKRPKTLKGMEERKFWTGDGRKTAPGEKAMKEMKKQAEELLLEKGETEKEELIGVKMFESLCDTVLGIVERWIPKKKYS